MISYLTICSGYGCSWDALSFFLCERASTKETKLRFCEKLEPARDGDIACTGGDSFEARTLADRTCPGKPDRKNHEQQY